MARTRTSRRGRNAIETPTLASGKLVWSVPIWHENPHLADLLPQRRKRTSFRVARENRDRGKPHSSTPPTPPDMRVRIRRFGRLSNRFHSQSGNPERVEVGIGQGDAERGRVRQPPWSMSAARRLRGQVGSHIPSA